jgi:DNA (cytosine-5)-methyltransferase 1
MRGEMRVIKTGSDFSGVGAFDYAIERACAKTSHTHERAFACDWDKFARQSYIAVHGEPEYYPKDVYEREIPTEPLDIYMTSPPCQSFSIAGKRGGKDDERGILFFNSHEFIQKNKPKTFIFENVKGLLSDDKHNPKDEHGRTFREWLNYLGGKSVNGVPVIFPDENAVPYHIYWTVLNSKEHGVPQNRERVFIVGIRDDQDNVFQWPRTEPLTKRLKDILESEVDPKYFLSQKMINCLLRNQEKTGFKMDLKDYTDTANCITTSESKMGTRSNFIKSIGNTNPSGNGMNGNVYDSDGISPTLSTNKGEGVKVMQKGEVLQRSQSGVHKLDNYYGTLRSGCSTTEFGVFDGYQIRRLTPLECFRLQDFPDSHVEKCKAAGVSDSQLYKQAGNSITVRVLELIIEKLLR